MAYHFLANVCSQPIMNSYRSNSASPGSSGYPCGGLANLLPWPGSRCTWSRKYDDLLLKDSSNGPRAWGPPLEDLLPKGYSRKASMKPKKQFRRKPRHANLWTALDFSLHPRDIPLHLFVVPILLLLILKLTCITIPPGIRASLVHDVLDWACIDAWYGICAMMLSVTS